MSAETIARQLRAVKTALQYVYVSDKEDAPLTKALAELIAAAGVSDIRDIGREIHNVTIPVRCLAASPVSRREMLTPDCPGNWTTLFEIWFNRKSLRNLPHVRMRAGEFLLNPAEEKYIDPRTGRESYASGAFAVLNSDAERTYYVAYLYYIGEGIPYFLIAKYVRPSGGVLKGVLASLGPALPILVFAANVFAPGLGAAVGAAVLGSATAAAYPALAAALGNAAISTVLSGGNVKAAVASSLAGFAGSAAGGTIAQTLDSQIAGSVAAAATSAVIVGGDPEEAAKRALLQSGAVSVSKG